MSDLWLNSALLCGGLVILALAGECLVRAALALAQRWQVSGLGASFLVIGFATSAPELFVSLTAAVADKPAIAIGNIIGSNIANVWLVLAIPALFFPFLTDGFGIRRAFFFVGLATGVFIAVTTMMPLTPFIGALFLSALLGYLILAAFSSQFAEDVSAGFYASHTATLDDRITAIIPAFLIGTLGLPLGAHLIIEGGVGLARTFDVSEYVIGLSLLAIGTSLPELGAATVAALRSRGDMVLGNILGSNIFNLLGAGGIIALFGPVPIASAFPEYHYWALGLATLTLAIFILSRARVSRLAAIAMLLVYTLYLYGVVEGWNLTAEVGGWIGE